VPSRVKKRYHLSDRSQSFCGGDMRLCGLFEDTPVPKHEINAEGIVTRVNEAECRLLGYSADQIIGKPVWMFVAPHQSEESSEAIRRKMAAEVQLFPFERELVTSSGAQVVVQIHENYIKNVHGGILGLRSVLLDITERKRQEELLQRQAAELARSNAELEQFAYVASHDLQAPLRRVSSYTQLLARRYKGKLDKDADEFINFAVENANRMQELITDLLALSRVGTRGSEFQNVDAGAVLARAIENLQVYIEENGAVITTDPLPMVWADPTQLGQLFQNLIGNAIKFHGAEAPHVWISVTEQDGGWCFSVRDNGIGLENKYSERIFQVFQRLHTEKEYPGTGIGLAICKKIMERHAGRIWVESTPGEGSCFYFNLPTHS
jgi:PAS domain S-box-containing protein